MTSSFQPLPEDFDDVRAHGTDPESADVEGHLRFPAVTESDEDVEGHIRRG